MSVAVVDQPMRKQSPTWGSRPRPSHRSPLTLGSSAWNLILLSFLLWCGGGSPAVMRGQEPATSPPDSGAVSPGPALPSLPILEPPLPSADAAITTAPVPALSPVAPAEAPSATALPADSGVGTAGGLPADDANAAPLTAPTTTRRFRYAFRLATGVIYDDNVSLRSNNGGGNSGGSTYFTIEPGVTAGFGDVVGKSANYIRLDYAPTAQLYTNASEANSLQHLIRLEGQYSFGRLTISGSQDVQILDGADLNVTTNTGTTVNRVNLDVSARTRVNIYVSRAIFSYGLTEKSALALALLYNNNAYASLISSQTSSGDFSYNYAYSPKLSLSLALSVGYLGTQEPDPSQTFEQVNVRVSYQASGKVAVNASVGLEVRQFQNSSDQNVTPVLELGALYQPFDGTTVSLSGSRRVLSSATLAGQDYTTTGFTVSVRQRFLSRFFPSLTLGYDNSEYFSTGTVGDPGANGAITTGSASRSDNYIYVQPSLEIRIRDNWSASIFYTHRENVSTGAASTGFNNNQFGVRTSISF